MRSSRSLAITAAAALAVLLLVGCSKTGAGVASTASGAVTTGPVVAVESFLADVTRQVAGGRFEVRAIVPDGVDPHEYAPTPRDAAAVAGARLIVENGGGLESFMTKLIANAGAGRPVAVASSGLTSRTAREGEVLEGGAIATASSTDPDPHFWLNPVNVETYTRNIRDALIGIDPADRAVYTANADAYIAKLQDLDAWIEKQVAAIPPTERMLVTNHESFGYFADRYGFRIIGTVIPSVSSDAAPSARQLARLVDGLKAAHARAVFLETGANPQLADQVAREAGISVVTSLYTHSLSGESGPAPTYIDMMRYDVTTIVKALAGSGS